jgi:hypothetical protein
MSIRLIVLAGAALLLAVPASAKEKHKHKHKEVERTCVCTMGHGPGGGPHVMAMPPIPAIPAIPAVPAIPAMPHAMWHGSADGNVMVFRDDDDERVVIVRKHFKDGKHGKLGKKFKRFHRRDSADTNGDGEVSRSEFLKRAERHFAERDSDRDGKLDDDEMMPMDFTIELPEPPEPPEPPMPPDPEDD